MRSLGQLEADFWWLGEENESWMLPMALLAEQRAVGKICFELQFWMDFHIKKYHEVSWN